jgi:hypothetical protein
LEGFKLKPRYGLRPLRYATDPEAGGEQLLKRGTSWNITTAIEQNFHSHFIELIDNWCRETVEHSALQALKYGQREHVPLDDLPVEYVA